MKNNNKNKVVFVVDSLTQPRCIKRILSFANAGYECEVYGYDRKKFNCNILPEGIKVTVLGEMKDGEDYLKKLKTLRKDIRGILKTHKSENPLFYSFGFISTLLFFLRRKEYIYEISDILYGYPKFDKVLWLFKWIDKRMIKKSIVTVMTSEGFREFLGLQADNIVIQPNKVNSTLVDAVREPMSVTKNQGLVFSFVGTARYDTIYRFAEVIGTHFPQHQFHFYGQAYGGALKVCTNLSSRFPNVKYYGAYKNPEELEGIYSKINIVVACYTPNSLNERLAEPNKLYESMFFCKPIIVSDGIFLARQVKAYQCGYCLDATSDNNIIDFVNNLDADDINRISSQDSRMDPNSLVDNPSEILDKVQAYYN